MAHAAPDSRHGKIAAYAFALRSGWAVFQAFLVYAFGVRVVDDGHKEPSALVDHAIDASRK